VNRVVQETNELGQSRYFAYDDGGYLTRRIDRRGLVLDFQYDTLGRNTADVWYNPVADAEWRIVTRSLPTDPASVEGVTEGYKAEMEKAPLEPGGPPAAARPTQGD
jgi:YD repeat-containing protein